MQKKCLLKFISIKWNLFKQLARTVSIFNKFIEAKIKEELE